MPEGFVSTVIHSVFWRAHEAGVDVATPKTIYVLRSAISTTLPIFSPSTISRSRTPQRSLAAFFCGTGDVMMAVDGEDHPTARIIRSFLASWADEDSSGEQPEWRQVGQTPAENALTADNGGVLFAVKDAQDHAQRCCATC